MHPILALQSLEPELQHGAITIETETTLSTASYTACIERLADPGDA
ncbi:hypothetical protein [Luteibacter yeojuensis]|nr:hypothetical protein [Luteibacter yeojuensis]